MQTPITAASPDDPVNGACCGTGVVEIKCSCTDLLLSLFDNALKAASKSQAQHKTVVIVKNGECVIKEKHKYYTQMQGADAMLQCSPWLSCKLQHKQSWII